MTHRLPLGWPPILGWVGAVAARVSLVDVRTLPADCALGLDVHGRLAVSLLAPLAMGAATWVGASARKARARRSLAGVGRKRSFLMHSARFSCTAA